MNTMTTSGALDQALRQITSVSKNLTHPLRDAAQRFSDRWEARARAAITIRALGSPTDRDLHVMGLNRGDIQRIAREDGNRRFD